MIRIHFMRRRIPFTALLALTTLSMGSGSCLAADAAAKYPARPIRLVVPQGAGASNDTLSRALSHKLGDALGQQIVVDNRPGAGGLIGMEIAAHSAPDGYTLLASATATQVIAPQLHRKLAFDPFKDLLPISLFGITHNALVVHPSVAAKSVKDFVALVRSAPGKYNMASAGAGSQSHLAGVQLMLAIGAESTHVPYKGGGASVAAVIANESQFTITPLPAVLAHVKAGRLRALGTGGERRSTQLPDVPTIAEAGLPKFQSTGWIGLMAPKGLPQPVFGKVRVALVQAMKQPDTREQIERQGGDPVVSTPEEFAKFIREEWDRFGAAIKAARLKVE
jgi:tripartite-type tricarboxylate transporter receptor subunit TctC